MQIGVPDGYVSSQQQLTPFCYVLQELIIDLLCASLILGNHATKKIYLHDYQILPCPDCRRCKKDDFTCQLLDGLSEIDPGLRRC